MKPSKVLEVPEGSERTMFAASQPQYLVLPATIDPNGLVTTEWVPSQRERDRLLVGGRIRISVLTLNKPLQPIKVEVTNPINRSSIEVT